ncbi:hypothetical protein ACELLULO517_15050 [Acidisoma cellulosilytica]|uniref:Uncharacterized protein n=1 Tax=Acidisoma cellulosilyticum TaxID=2802395 RepID=A0A964E4Q1_9PROT|nr:hypothetical protein [Acidisoma cellulosilyticum]MCB8881567.1 hypothetical protein [Acidisoma cellulosilyticum]
MIAGMVNRSGSSDLAVRRQNKLDRKQPMETVGFRGSLCIGYNIKFDFTINPGKWAKNSQYANDQFYANMAKSFGVSAHNASYSGNAVTAGGAAAASFLIGLFDPAPVVPKPKLGYWVPPTAELNDGIRSLLWGGTVVSPETAMNFFGAAIVKYADSWRLQMYGKQAEEKGNTALYAAEKNSLRFLTVTRGIRTPSPSRQARASFMISVIVPRNGSRAAPILQIGLHDLLYQYTVDKISQLKSPQALYQFLKGPDSAYLADDHMSRSALLDVWWDNNKNGEWNSGTSYDSLQAKAWHDKFQGEFWKRES